MATEDGENPPNATVYVKNLDEKVNVNKMSDTLRELFEAFGNIIDIVAKKNVKAKGQAFIVYDSVESAQDAIDTIQGFDVFGKPIRLEFAKSRSDATVMREDGEEALETHKRHRLAEKERKQAIEAAQKPAKRPAPESLAERPAKTAKSANALANAVPDEYLPPNKILFVQDKPESTSKDELVDIFSRYAGFKEVRVIPVRKTIAFVEYENEEGAITAKESTAGMMIGENAIRVTFARQG